MISKKLIKVSEYYKFLISLKEDERFSIEEIEILESKFSSNIQDISRHTLEQIIQMQEYVGYIIPPFYISMFFDNLMNTNFNNRSNNNHRYSILLSVVYVFSAIIFLASYEDIQQSLFANPQVTMKDQMMNNMMGMQNQNMMMDPSPMQTMMGQQMNK